MRYGQMRNYVKASFAVVMLGMAGACADNQTVAPANQAATIVAPANFSFTGTAVEFRVDNSAGIVQRIGNHTISIPAGAICDLETSGYGPAYWDAPCDPLVGSIVITGTVFEDADGQPYIDFQPSMRFAPDKDVMLFAKQGRNSPKMVLQVNYCNAVGYCYDESINDATLKPFRVGNTPTIGRRIKHFTGYNIGSGGDYCPGTVVDNGDGTYWCEEGGLTRKSGYMVASGEDIVDIMKDDPTVKNEKDEKER
jgi:hypothetical protein